MNSTSEKPLVTFALFAYNQEKFIREAVEGALAQDYEPLEIILSDDCSSDSTFEIIEDIVRNYNGKHSIIINRNIKNCGLAEHINLVMRMASGDLIVVAAGDDISLSHRVQKNVDAWKNSNAKTILIQSNFYNIDELGNNLNNDFLAIDSHFEHIEKLINSNMFIVGATAAFTKNLMKDFPSLLPELVHEDRCTPFRARLLNASVFTIKEPLILYRRNGGLSSAYSGQHNRSFAQKFFHRVTMDYCQKKIDAESVGRTDLLPLIQRKINAYMFAEHCADKSYPLTQLVSDFFHQYPPLWFSLKQFIKFRMGVGRYVSS